MHPRLLAISVAALTSFGCLTPIGVRETGFEPVYRSSRTNVLDKGVPSATSRQVLSYLGLEKRYDREPAAVIAELEAANSIERARAIQVVIAELNYDLALAQKDRGRFLAAAVHAYLYFFGEGFAADPNPYSPSFRLACDLYNRGLARALLEPTGTVNLDEREFETPAGTVVIRSTRPGFPWSEEIFDTFLPADAFEVRGLSERVRTSGLGVPLIAVQSEGTELGLSAERVRRRIKLPATAFLRLTGGLDDFLAGRLTATLELHLGTDVPSVEIARQRIPLAADITTPLAYSLENAKIWDFDLRGFLNGTTREFPTGMFVLQPFQAGKIPLVLVHGTASSPVAWAETINRILAVPRLRTHFQIWLALYNTGNPIAYSAALLRESLTELHDTLDPDGDDPALSNMVIVGHSQGGLITRLLVTDSGDKFWNSIFDEPIDAYPFEPELREFVSKTFFFEPLPFLKRAVFISTPHRGSFFATGWTGRIASRMIELPKDLKNTVGAVLELGRYPAELRELPTSVDNMDPDHRFVRTLAEFPFAEALHLHSIIAVKPGQRSIEKGDDGIVQYASAHLDEAESEFIVRHTHSCQGEPATIGELRRILLEHLEDDAEVR